MHADPLVYIRSWYDFGQDLGNMTFSSLTTDLGEIPSISILCVPACFLLFETGLALTWVQDDGKE